MDINVIICGPAVTIMLTITKVTGGSPKYKELVI
jgi:hypothetical protein